jgi:hypothetical protein
MKKYLIIALFQLISNYLFSQINNNDSSQILYTSKFQVLESEKILFIDIQELNNYIDKIFYSRFLKSKGFGNTFFILIEKRKDIDSSFIKSHLKELKNNEIFFTCDYILAYVPSTRLFYRLKGFRKNDFVDLIGFLKNEYPYLNLNDLKENIELGIALVEDLDLNCLNEYYFIDNKNEKRNKSYPCLKSCEERDRMKAYVE